MTDAVINRKFWEQIAASWIVVYSKEDMLKTQQAAESVAEDIFNNNAAIPDALASALALLEDDDGDYY